MFELIDIDRIRRFGSKALFILRAKNAKIFDELGRDFRDSEECYFEAIHLTLVMISPDERYDFVMLCLKMNPYILNMTTVLLEQMPSMSSDQTAAFLKLFACVYNSTERRYQSKWVADPFAQLSPTLASECLIGNFSVFDKRSLSSALNACLQKNMKIIDKIEPLITQPYQLVCLLGILHIDQNGIIEILERVVSKITTPETLAEWIIQLPYPTQQITLFELKLKMLTDYDSRIRFLRHLLACEIRFEESAYQPCFWGLARQKPVPLGLKNTSIQECFTRLAFSDYELNLNPERYLECIDVSQIQLAQKIIRKQARKWQERCEQNESKNKARNITGYVKSALQSPDSQFQSAECTEEDLYGVEMIHDTNKSFN